MKKVKTIKRDNFDVMTSIILANKKLSLDSKARAIMDLKNNITFPKRVSRF